MCEERTPCALLSALLLVPGAMSSAPSDAWTQEERERLAEAVAEYDITILFIPTPSTCSTPSLSFNFDGLTIVPSIGLT